MNTSQKLALPNRIFKVGTEPNGFERINKRSDLTLVSEVKGLLGSDFKKLETSFLSPIIKLGLEENIYFSAKLVHHLLLRRVLTRNQKKELWFTFAEQPMRFSLREFILTTGLPWNPVVAKPSSTGNDGHKKGYSWMEGGRNLNDLVFILKKGESTMSSDEKVRLGATILVQGILLAQNKRNKIPIKHFKQDLDFEEYCSYPWGKEAYDALVDGVVNLTASDLSGEQYQLPGFSLAIQLWALSSVHQLGTTFGRRAAVSTTDGPLCLEWTHTRTPRLNDIASIAKLDKVEVKCIIGDPKLYSNLVVEEDVDVEFGKVIGLVEKGYRIKTSDWAKGYIDILVASREIENPFCTPVESDEYSEKLDKLTKLVTSLQKKLEQGNHTQDKEGDGEEGDEEREGEGEEDKEEEETENEWYKNNKVLPLSQGLQKLVDGQKKAQLSTYKRRKRAREEDNESATACCQTQGEEEEEDDDDDDDSITIAQIIKSRNKCGDVKDTGGERSRLEVGYNVSGLAQNGGETVALTEIEKRSEEKDESNSSDPCNGAAEKEEEEEDDGILKQRKLAIEEQALKLEARILKVENTLAKAKQWKMSK